MPCNDAIDLHRDQTEDVISRHKQIVGSPALIADIAKDAQERAGLDGGIIFGSLFLPMTLSR